MRINILGIAIDNLTMAQAAAQVRQYVAQGLPRRVVTANPELIYRAQNDESLKGLINTADLVTADGEGVVWAARYLGTPVAERVTGIDLVQALLPVADAEKWRVFLLGAAPGVASEAAAKLKQKFPQITFAHYHGYFQEGPEERAVLKQIKDFAPHLLLVGLGAPRQEQWIKQHCQELGVPVSIGVGGSLDVLSGRLRRAPRWTQRLKIEWLYRLARQPWRLKRQLNLPRFVWKIVYTKLIHPA